ncbi:R3H domain-containing protein 1-like isoform X1 [Petromyzon marinus]|uniref:R3H domain-containing protein 1-like isoform X1 n=1 Tax=Petromyzon marinus TaxID=7757 RepID=UPI003F6FB077
MIEPEELPLVIDSDIHSKVPVVVEIIPAKGTDRPFVRRDLVNPVRPLRAGTVSPLHQLSGGDLTQVKVDNSLTMVNSGGQGIQGRAETARQQQLGVVISCGRPGSDNDSVVYYATKDDGLAGDSGPQAGRQTPRAYVEMPNIVIDAEMSAVEPTKATASPPTQDLNYAEFADVSHGDEEEDGEGREGASRMKATAHGSTAHNQRHACEEVNAQVDGEQQREGELPVHPLENFSREERAEADSQLDLPADAQKRMQSQVQSRKRAKSGVKMKLVRSLAVCDEPSPPLVDGDGQESQEPQLDNRNRKEEERPCKEGSGKEKLAEKALSDKPEKAAPKAQKVLSRDSSQDYTDSTGVDVHEFLVNTLRNNPRDRMMLLKMEQELTDFVQDNKQHYRKFPPMTSYHRMLVHRVAAYFGMDHNVDQTGKAVVVNKTPSTRIPEQRFSEHFKDDGPCDEAQKRFILKRDNSSLDKDDMQRIRLLQGERRSKSIEEREEEYQRARERIFAQDAISAQDTPQIEIRIQEDGSTPNSTHKRRQMFRSRKDSGRLSNGGRQSSTDTELRPSEPRPWSSTDSESSGHRLSRPAVTKASSFGGISVLVRGDSTSSSNKSSVGRLSKTGSESSSSVGSSSGSLARPAETSTTAAPSVPGPMPSGLVGSGGMAVGMGPPAASGPSYYLLHLDSAGIPPGSILINPQTGQPLLNADGSLAVYNPPTGQVQQPQQQQQQQQIATQMVGPGTCQQLLHQRPNPQQRQQLPHQAAQCVALASQPGSYPLASYAPSTATHHPAAPTQPLMPVLHTQQQQQYHTPEELGPHFGQISLNRQTSGDTLDAMQPHGHAAMCPVMVQGSQQPAYIGVSGISGLLHQGGFHMGASAGPTGQGSTGQQPGLQQQQSYGQAQQHGQMTVYFCPPSPYPPPGQQYRGGATMQYSGSRGQQPSYQPMSAVPQPAYVSMQPPPGQGMMPGQQGGLAHPMPGALGSPVQGPVGSTLQGMMSHYPPMSAYHMAQAAPLGPVPPPPPPQQQYQQPVLLSGQPHGTMPPMFCSMGQPALQSNLSGSVLGYLQPPGMEQLQFPRTQSPAASQPPHGQHYAVFGYVQGQRPPSPLVQQHQQHQHHHHGLAQAHRGPSASHVPAGLSGGPPTAAPASHMGSKSPPTALTLVPGLSPGGHGVFLMQLSLPSGAHPAHAPSPTRWGQRRGLSLDQRLPRGAEFNHADFPVQGSPHLHSPMLSPSQSPSSTPLAALGSIRSGLLPLPMVQHRHIAPMHGDIRYPLLGPHLQYNSQPCSLQPQTPHSMSMQQVRLGGRGRRMPHKALSEDASSVEPAVLGGGATLEVTDLPAGIYRSEVDSLLSKLSAAGGELHWFRDATSDDVVATAIRPNRHSGAASDVTKPQWEAPARDCTPHWESSEASTRGAAAVPSQPNAHRKANPATASKHADTNAVSAFQGNGAYPDTSSQGHGKSEVKPHTGTEPTQRHGGSKGHQQQQQDVADRHDPNLASNYKVVAVFPSHQQAQATLARLGHGPSKGYRLRPFWYR